MGNQQQKYIFFSDPESRDQWLVRLLKPVIYVVLIATFLLFILGFFFDDPYTIQIVTEIFIFTSITLWLLNKNKIGPAIYIFMTALMLGAIYGITVTRGIHDTSMLIIPGIILLSSILLERKAFYYFSFINFLFVVAVGIGQVYGITGNLYQGETTFMDVFVSSSILLGIVTGVLMLNSYLFKTMNALFQSEEQLTKSNEELEKRAIELAASENRWRSLVNNAPDFILHINKDGTILFSNQHYPGIHPDDKTSIFRFVPDDHHETIKKAISDVFDKRQKITCDIQYQAPDGTYRWLSNHAAPIEENSMISSAIIIGKDITEMLELQEQLLQSQKMESMGNLAGGIAHDFNNLLTVINGHAQLAEMNIQNGKAVNEDIRAIMEAGYKAANLTRQILAFSRKELIQPEKINFAEVIDNFKKMKSMLIGENIELLINIAPDLPIIYADRNQVEQVLINLLVNARDAINSPENKNPKKVISIEAIGEVFDEFYEKDNLVQQSGKHLVISVTDSGIGMEVKTKAHIFEPFFTTKETGTGTGLGLAMVYGIIKQNKSSIHVYSEPGKGTTFKIFWPAAKETKKISTIPDQTIEIRGNERILIVEDDEGVRNFAAAALQTLGYEIFTQKNGNDAINFFEKNRNKIDMVITDVIMPGMNGKEMADQMSAMKSNLKILFCSGYTDSYIQSSGILHEGIHFINKPYSPRDLALKVREFLDEK